MYAGVIIDIVTIIVMVISSALFCGKKIVGSITAEIFDEKTKNEKNLIRHMGNMLLIIMSLVLCVSVWNHFDTMVCFAMLIPMMTRSMEDALCATTYIGKVMKYSLMLLFATGFTIILAAFFNDRILDNNIVKAMILIAVSAVPFKAFVDMFNKKEGDASCCG